MFWNKKKKGNSDSKYETIISKIGDEGFWLDRDNGMLYWCNQNRLTATIVECDGLIVTIDTGMLSQWIYPSDVEGNMISDDETSLFTDAATSYLSNQGYEVEIEYSNFEVKKRMHKSW